MMEPISIRFGTSGWRGVMCDEFTFANVRVVTQAIADHLLDLGEDSPAGVLVGHDNRFMGDMFAKSAAEVLAGNGIRVFLVEGSVPTPVISFDIIENERMGGINFTASHNPPEYNGLKFSPGWGGPALPETTGDIEERANRGMASPSIKAIPFDEGVEKGLIVNHDPRPQYLARLEELVDFNAIGEAELSVGFDPLFGTSVGYLDHLLTRAGCIVSSVNTAPDPYFGGRPPEPSPENIPELIGLVREKELDLGLATDGDADRFGIIDPCGEFLQPNYFLALLFDYLVRECGFEGGVARSVATTHLVDLVAESLGRTVHETPVGFKFIGDLIRRGEVAVGGEESAGLSIAGHVPEKDGILACCLAAEMVAIRGKSLLAQLEELYDRVGRLFTMRVNLRLSVVEEELYEKNILTLPTVFNGQKVARIVTLDGIKLIMEDGDWVLVRKSGTEPVVRIYAESSEEDELDNLIGECTDWLLG